MTAAGLRVNPDTLLLALAIKPGSTAHQIAGRLGLRVTYGSRSHVSDYHVRRQLADLEQAGAVRHEDVPGGRGKLGFHRVWYPASTRLDDGTGRLEVISRWLLARRGAA